MSLQQFAAINHSVCTCRTISCCSKLRDTSQRQIASCLLVNSCANRVSQQQNFVAATSRTNSVWFDFVRLVAATQFCCGHKHFHKTSPVHTERFVAATCCCDLSRRDLCSNLKTYNIMKALNEEKNWHLRPLTIELKIDYTSTVFRMRSFYGHRDYVKTVGLSNFESLEITDHT